MIKIINSKKLVLKIVCDNKFNDLIKINDFDFDILLDEKSYENTLIYEASYKVLMGPKPLHCMFDKVDVFIRDYDGTKYLVLFGLKNMPFLIGLNIS